MRRNLIVLLIFTLGVPAWIRAQDKPKNGPQPGAPGQGAQVPGAMVPGMAPDPAKALAEFQQKMLQQFDINKDGQLSDQEQLMAQEAMRRQGWGALGAAAGGFPGMNQ